MSFSLVIENPISDTMQDVEDSDGNTTPFRIGAQTVRIRGTDTVGGSFPLRVTGLTSPEAFDSGTTWGRILRLQDLGTTQNFYDIGIDKSGNLFISMHKKDPILTISPEGNVTISGDLTVNGTLYTS